MSAKREDGEALKLKVEITRAAGSVLEHALAGRDARAPGLRRPGFDLDVGITRRLTMTDETRKHSPDEEPPPFGGSWRTLYTVVLLNLALLVVLFYLFTRAFR
jgi:hypothetical protein